MEIECKVQIKSLENLLLFLLALKYQEKLDFSENLRDLEKMLQISKDFVKLLKMLRFPNDAWSANPEIFRW